MIEHRLIERVIRLWRKELESITSSAKVDLNFVGFALDFMRTYSDRCHHGKEEDILFRVLEQKPLPEPLKRILAELVEEHNLARSIVAVIAEAREKYAAGDRKALDTMARAIADITRLYPPHIQKEDKQFFLPAMEYLSKQEKDDMLADFQTFDQALIHEKYRAAVAGMERT